MSQEWAQKSRIYTRRETKKECQNSRIRLLPAMDIMKVGVNSGMAHFVAELV
jgi:hypothetical protein